MDETKPPGLQIAHIFVVKANFEHRDDFLALPPNEKVEVEVLLQSAIQIDEDAGLGIVAVAAKSNDELNPAYRFHVEICGIVSTDKKGPNMTVKEYLGTNGPTMMIPFLREAVASITGRGRFGPVYINPINMLMGRKQEDVTPDAAVEGPAKDGE